LQKSSRNEHKVFRIRDTLLSAYSLVHHNIPVTFVEYSCCNL